jgi:RES domain
LDDLFGKPEEYEGGAIKPVYALKAGQRIFRARILDDEFTFDRLTGNPAVELGAPPRAKARAGRMNVEYIPAFYAAFSEGTAVAELRPGISDQVAVATFVLQKDIRVFDFTAFSRPDSDRKELQAHALRIHYADGRRDQYPRPED